MNDELKSEVKCCAINKLSTNFKDKFHPSLILIKVKWKYKCKEHKDQNPNKVPGCVYRSPLTLGTSD